MPPLGFFVDANLLVLLIVGSIDERIIARHRRLEGYTVADYVDSHYGVAACPRELSPQQTTLPSVFTPQVCPWFVLTC